MVQLAKQAGAIVIGTASGDERLNRLRDFGLDHGINYLHDDIVERALSITGGEGVDLVVDLAGGKGLAALLESIRYRGRLVIIGAATGERQTLSFADIAPRALTVVGRLFGKDMHTERAHQLVDTMFADVSEGKVNMPIDRVFPLQEAAAAHRYAEEGHPFGRVIIEP